MGSYGTDTNSAFLSIYGFTVENNRAKNSGKIQDYVSFRLTLKTDEVADKLLSARRKFLFGESNQTLIIAP
jgi:hypothetical protein